MLNQYTKQFHTKYFLIILIAVFAVTFFAPSAVHAAYRDTIEADSPLFYWPMDEVAGATSLTAAVGGTAINLTGATAGASGQVDGTAVSFNGTSNSAQTASNLDLTAHSKIVVEALVYIPSYTDVGRTIWEFSPNVTNTPSDTFFYAVDGGVSGSEALSNVALQGDGGYSIATYTRPTAGNWHHIVTVYDKGLASNEVSFYIDGVLQTATRPYNSNSTNNFGNRVLYLMARGASSLFSQGTIQHLAIYSNLSESAITAHSAAAFAPASLSAGTLSETSHSTSTATVSWTAGSGGTAPITTQLQRSPSGAATWSNVSGATVSPVTDSGLTPATTYDYRVVYTDAVAATSNSNTLAVTLDALPSPATAITLSGPTSGTLGNASTNFTIGSNGSVTGSVVVTPSDGGGGTFTPTTVTLTTTSTGTFTYTPSSTGTKTISVTNNGSLTNPSPINFIVVGSGLVLGDSTVATYAGSTQIADFLYTTAQTNAGWTVTNIAVPGHTIAQQKTTYLSTGSRSTVDYTITQIGLNDLDPTEAASVAIARLQDLIDTINSNKKSGALTIISTMIPIRERLIDIYGATNGPISYQKWLDMNNAIKGLGATPITGVDYRISNHTPLLDDGAGNLAAIYDTGDHVHENNTARQIIARVWRDSLAELNLLSPATSSAPIIGTATAGDSSATVTFSIPQFNGGASITGYTVTSIPSGGTDTNTGTTGLSHVLTGLTNGTSYTFTVTATNSAGTSDASSASNSVTPVDTTAPVRSVGSPSGTLAFGTTGATLSLTTNENATCKYGTVSGTAYASISNTFTTTGGTSQSASLTSLSNTTSYTYYVRCQDGQGNNNSSDYTISFSVAADSTVPTVSVTAPTGSATVSGSTVVVSADASDNDTVAGVKFYYDDTNLIGSEDISSPYAVTWDSTGVADGLHTLSAVARDNTGNVATSSSVTVTVHNTVPAPVSSGGGGGFSAPYPTAPSEGFTATRDITNSQNKTVLHFGFGNDITNIAISDNANFTPATYINATSSVEWTATTTKILYIKYCNRYGRCSNPIPLQINAFVPIVSNSYKFYKNLSYRMTNSDVKELQKYLNTHGVTVAPSGAGSLGKETNYFGLLTYKALVKFQKSIGWSGTGFFGPMTRAFINK